MGDQDKSKRPLAKKQAGQVKRPIKIMGSKSVKDMVLPEEVADQLALFGNADNFAPANEPLPPHPQNTSTPQPQPQRQVSSTKPPSRDSLATPKARLKSSKIEVVSDVTKLPEPCDEFDGFEQSAEIDAPFDPPELNEQQVKPQVATPPQNFVVEDSGIEFRTKEKQHQPPPRGKTIPVSFHTGQEHRAFPVPLPSRGVLYGGAYSNGHITVRPITTKEESVLYSQGEILNHVNRIINGCVVNPEIDPMELLTCDRFALLLFLRVFSYGQHYEVPFKCTECDNKNTTTVDLVKELEITHMEDGSEEPFEFDFPLSNNFVHFRLLRGRDEAEISKKAKRLMLKSMDDGDPSRIYRWATAIVGINGEEVGFEEALKFVENLLPGDAHSFNDHVDDIEGGIDTTIYRECSFCGATQEFTMPFTAEFFRPIRKRRRRTF